MEITACKNPESLSQNGGRENDTGIYISEKQGYEANGICPTARKNGPGEVMECHSDAEALDLRNVSLKSGPAATAVHKIVGEKLYRELLKSPPQSIAGQ